MELLAYIGLCAAVLTGAFLVLGGSPGFFVLFVCFALWLALLEFLLGLAYLAYVRCGKELVVKAAGHPPKRPSHPLAFLGRTFLTLVIGAATCAALLILLQSWLARNAPHFPSGPDLTVLGNTDAGWTLQALDGQEVSFGSLQGRAVFLNIWATWCPPCIAEVPSIQDLHDALKDEGVAVVLITPDPLDEVRPFVEKKAWHVPVYVARRGVPPVFRTETIPATFILNRRGEVVYRHTGRADWNTEECRAFLRRLQRE
jgi:thiol-disulfide isomerase/thioredoxin